MSTDLHATAEVALGARLLRRRGRASAGRAGRGRGPRRRHTASLLVRTCFKASGAGGDAAGGSPDGTMYNGGASNASWKLVPGAITQ